jgi:hypothetical protein
MSALKYLVMTKPHNCVLVKDSATESLPGREFPGVSKERLAAPGSVIFGVAGSQALSVAFN